MFPFDSLNVQLLDKVDHPSFDPNPLIEQIFSQVPQALFLPQILRFLLSGNLESVTETLEGGLNAIAADSILSKKDKEGLISDLNALQTEVYKRAEEKKLILIPESLATGTLYFHPHLGLELTVTHQAKQALLNQDIDNVFLAEPILLANKKAFKQAFFDEPSLWVGFMQPFLKQMLSYLQNKGAKPSYIDFLNKPEFAKGATLYAKMMQDLLQKPTLQLDITGRNLIIH